MDSVGGDVEFWEIDCEPQVHIIAASSHEMKSSVCILASTVLSCRVFLVSQPKERPASCTTVVILPIPLAAEKPMGRRNHVLFPAPILHMLSSSLTHSSDSTELRWNFDSKVRKG